MNDFLCPVCQEHIRVGDNIIFKVKNQKKQSALLLLSPQIGTIPVSDILLLRSSRASILSFIVRSAMHL
jgi:hypothetical protein